MALRLIADGAPEFDQWAAAHAVTGAPDDDDDLDGISNEFEFILDLRPHVPKPLPSPVFNEARNEISWSVPVRSDLAALPYTVRFEVSFDLKNWVSPTEAGLSQTTENGFLKLTGPVTHKELYMRLRAESTD